MKPARRRLLGATLAAPAALPTLAAPADSSRKKILRYAFPIAETGFDPAQINDLYSATVTAHIFEAPLRFDYLARPAQLRPNVAAAMPEISSDFRTITVRLRPGIFFADDPAFNTATMPDSAV